MLELAIKAGIPIIRVRTSDLLNIQQVLETLAPDKKVAEYGATMGVPRDVDVVYAVDDYTATQDSYNSFVEMGKTMVLINQGEESQFVFDAGEMPVPRELMVDLLGEVVPKKKIPELLPCFSGLTLKASAEIIRLTTAKDKSLTARGITSMRAQLTGTVQGLSQVNTEMPLYLCPEELKVWVQRNKRYFLEAVDHRLVPRGVLLNGEPGVGKSAGAKYIANEFGVPLYRLDVASALGKFVGESEQALSRVFRALDQEEAGSILLCDEIEKIFTEQDDSGVTSRLLAQLLWWAQEHTSRVLLVMTTNNVDALPKELYRAGRIDATLTINPLNTQEAWTLARAVLGQFFTPTKAQNDLLRKAVWKLFVGEQKVAHATVVQVVYDLIKTKQWK